MVSECPACGGDIRMLDVLCHSTWFACVDCGCEFTNERQGRPDNETEEYRGDGPAVAPLSRSDGAA